MAVLTDAEVRTLWYSVYQLGRGKEEIKASGLPDEATRKADFQAAEDAIVASGLDINTLVSQTSFATQRHTDTKASLDSGRIPLDLRPVIEDYLGDVFTPIRAVDEAGRDAWIAANQGLFGAMSGTPAYRDTLVRAVLDYRIKAVL